MGIAFQNSPGTVSREIDLTNSVVAEFSSAGAFAGAFNWGPVDEVFTIASAKELEARTGKPSNALTALNYAIVSNFLAYSGGIRLVRAAHTLATASEAVALNATSAGTGLLVKNDTDFANAAFVSVANAWAIAKYPGIAGNSLKVVVADAATFSSTGFAAYKKLFDAAPSTSGFSKNKNIATSLDEVHAVVVDENGYWSGVSGTVLETYPFLSRFSDAKTTDGEANYFAKVINRKSKYVRIDESVTAGLATAIPSCGVTSVGQASNFAFVALDGNSVTAGAQVVSVSLTGGVDAFDQVTDGDKIIAYNFLIPETVDVSVLIAGDATAVLANHLIQNIAEARGDCIVAISPPKNAVVNNYGHEVTDILAFRNELPSTSYAVLDSGWKYQYNRFQDNYIWVPLCGDTAGLIAQTDIKSEPWFSPADPDFSTIKNIVKLAFNPDKNARDDLYKLSVNSIIDSPGFGTVLYGDKTLLDKNSAFSRINVRKLFIILKKSITKASRYTLFKINDEITQARFRATVIPFLTGIKGRRGVTDFLVVCDSTNNTAEVVDTNNFVGDIFVKPSRSINFITLNFVAVPTGVSFTEVVGTI